MAIYRYAKNKNGKIFDIVDLTTDIRDSNEFYCIGCDMPMRAALGDVNEHYFAHNNPDEQGNCKETYLHKLGKIRFMELFRKHQESGEPLYITFNRKTQCEKNSCPYGRKKPCTGYISEKYELFPRYNHAAEEEWNENYKPDVRLSNDKGEELFIEIFVTHPCSEDKINYGTPIIEFHLESDEDLNIISEKQLSILNNPRITFYNSPTDPIYHPPTCKEKVQRAIDLFIEKHKNCVKDGKGLYIPYQSKFICPEKSCPYFKNPNCKSKLSNEKLDLASQLPDIEVKNVFFLKNKNKKLRIDFVFEFDEHKYPTGERAIQYRIDDILKNNFNR